MSQCNTVFRKTSARASMLRRGRSSRARHVAWSDTRQDPEVTAAVHTADREEREGRAATQISEPESEMDRLVGPGAGPEVAVLPCAAPGKRESFSLCEPPEELSPDLWAAEDDCVCREEDQVFDWVWDEHRRSSGASLSCGGRKVSFHSDYSCGTAAVRGTRALTDGQHYWEVQMTSPVYGTDVMVGVGTSEVNLDKFKYSFGSLLGHDEDSWGLSYTGLLQHKGDKVKFSPRFGQGSIIGVHLDTWHGTLTFYKNRHCLGVAATRLQTKRFFPMVCSTAAKSSMRVTCARSTPTSLQYLCCARLRQALPGCADVPEALRLPPGLRAVLHTRLGWLFALSAGPDPSQEEEEESYVAGVPSGPGSTPQEPHAACRCPPTPPSSDYDSCCSEPEDYQCKRCRWT